MKEEMKRKKKKKKKRKTQLANLKREWNGLARNSTVAPSSLKPEKPYKNT
jgi:hypothetical protein